MEKRIYLERTIYFKGIDDLEKEIGVPEKFFSKLIDEDDWSFVIKLHALIESSCTQLLLHHLNEPTLQQIISRLELSNKTTGKLAILKATDLLSSNYRKYISHLSELRNNLVHNIKNCNFNLNKMVDEFESKELKNFAIAFSPFESNLREIELSFDIKNDFRNALIEQSDINNLIQRAKDNPKMHIWFGAHNLLIKILDMHGYSDYLQMCKKPR